MNEITPFNPTEEEPREDIIPAVGSWCWVKFDKLEPEYHASGSPDPDNYPLFAIAFHVGSNYVLFRSPGRGNSHRLKRILIKDLEDKIIREPNPKKIINENIQSTNQEIQSHLTELNKLTMSLGINLSGQICSEHTGTTSIVPTSVNQDAKRYKQELIEANKVTIPKLTEQIEEGQKQLQRWLSMEVVQMKALTNSMNNASEIIEKRIFNIGLYAGITEDVELIKDGEPAGILDKVHLMQRRLYMDEECLLSYETGGMEFKDIHQFDKWLSKEKNFKRCLPYPKCIVTFQVRRDTKDREDGDTLMDRFIKLNLERSDKYTYMYIRNGEKLYRLSSDIDFGELIFPNLTDFDPQKPKMMKMFCNQVREIKSVADWEFENAEILETNAKHEQWFKDNPYDEWVKSRHDKDSSDRHLRFVYNHENPYKHIDRYDFGDWHRIDQDSVYYDEGMEYLNEKMDEYNRIALIVQGLLDRSDILHPHPPVNLKEENNFRSRVKLIYDGDHTLYFGEKPSVEEYIRKCNAEASKESVFIGQQIVWMRREGIKETARRRECWGHRNYCDVKYYRPEGNPGPDHICKSTNFRQKAQTVTFKWQRRIVSYRSASYGELRNCSITIPLDKVFNVSAYKPGDYLRFYEDPRTRAEYTKWAHLFLAAEEYHAGSWNPHNFGFQGEM